MIGRVMELWMVFAEPMARLRDFSADFGMSCFRTRAVPFFAWYWSVTASLTSLSATDAPHWEVRRTTTIAFVSSADIAVSPQSKSVEWKIS